MQTEVDGDFSCLGLKFPSKDGGGGRVAEKLVGELMRYLLLAAWFRRTAVVTAAIEGDD